MTDSQNVGGLSQRCWRRLPSPNLRLHARETEAPACKQAWGSADVLGRPCCPAFRSVRFPPLARGPPCEPARGTGLARRSAASRTAPPTGAQEAPAPTGILGTRPPCRCLHSEAVSRETFFFKPEYEESPRNSLDELLRVTWRGMIKPRTSELGLLIMKSRPLYTGPSETL